MTSLATSIHTLPTCTRCTVCGCRNDAAPFEHAGRAIAALSDTERTVLSSVTRPTITPDPLLPAVPDHVLQAPRLKVLHAWDLLAALPAEDELDACFLADTLIAGGH